MVARAPGGWRVRTRLALLAWHRWFGLGASLWLLLLALTGSAITFYDEIDTWLNPDLRTTGEVVATSDAPAPLELAIARAQEALPGFEPWIVEFPHAPGRTLWMLGHEDSGGVERDFQLFSHPDDGRVLGWREQGRFALDRRHVMDVLYGLHVDLMLGPVVTWLFGLVSLLWLLDHLAAAWLSLPRLAAWRDAFRLAGPPGSGRRRHDRHRAPGMWLLVLTFVMSLTGVTLAWPEASRDAVGVLSPVSGRLDWTMPPAPDTPRTIDIDQAIARVQAQQPDARIHSVRILPRVGAYAVRTFDPRDVDQQGRLWTYVAMDDGRLRGQRHDRGESAGDALFVWQYALHSGQAFGLPGRVAVFVSGVGTALVCVTGVWLWWRRRRAVRGTGGGRAFRSTTG
ncbi:PepSY-associated TM helix domain-containing protein [Luteimonas kalidii]|uniref:PepSY-associated TM helix domain-containing protein n=1 Tax=Luteimonas kalidii TaxID=3042025 RepID=A0ABT6JQG7_9GAMM|nr:PepSY-associated TM helix domain-containing protein [Luteimonas kalidii]MDH5832910.1 PepSY-associated TM helix domain-containing protein [Luteimonas kalidii]